VLPALFLMALVLPVLVVGWIGSKVGVTTGARPPASARAGEADDGRRFLRRQALRLRAEGR